METNTPVCKTCGKETEEYGHLCDPRELKEAHI